MVICMLWSLTGLHAHTAWIIISALISSKKPVTWKKTQRISLFHAIHQDRISDKVNTVAERVHLNFLGFERRDSESKNSFLANLDGLHLP